MAKKDGIVVGLDIGTTKICAVVGAIREDDRIEIIGMGTSPSLGLRKGVVVNIESTVESIKKAVGEAEMMAGVEINSVYVGIAGGHIKGFDSKGTIALKDQEVTASDIRHVIEVAQAVQIPKDQEILHVLTKEFIIDNQDGIRTPLGMSGVRLQADVYIITAAVTSLQNLTKCVQKAGLDFSDVILQPLASSEAVLTPEEQESGVVMVDIGGGTTDIATFVEGGIWHTSVLGIGGNHLTKDIAIGLKTPEGEAEKIKVKFGCAMTSMVRDDEAIEVPSFGDRQPRVLSRQILSEIIEPRAEEIFSLVAKEIQKVDYDKMAASGVVITGGAAIMEGMPELAEKVLDLPVRRGIPHGVDGLVDIIRSPQYATAVGLILYVLGNKDSSGIPRYPRGRGFFQRTIGGAWNWLKDSF